MHGSEGGEVNSLPYPYQTPWMDLSLPSMALDTHFPSGMTSFLII
jgi:hypothetical protein